MQWYLQRRCPLTTARNREEELWLVAAVKMTPRLRQVSRCPGVATHAASHVTRDTPSNVTLFCIAVFGFGRMNEVFT